MCIQHTGCNERFQALGLQRSAKRNGGSRNSSALDYDLALSDHVVMSYYRYHVFFCTNQRSDGRACCQDFDAQSMRDYVKAQVKSRGLAGPDGVRINTAGCLDRCDLGPVLVVYPEATWYTYVDKQDLDEIIDQHLVGGKVVERLLIDD